MSQENVPIDTCPRCEEKWLTHHKFLSFTSEGYPNFECQPKPLAATDLVVQYIIGLRTDKLKAQAELKEFTAQAEVTKVRREKELKRKTRADAIEETRVSMAETHQALVKDLSRQLEESQGKLAESERKRAGDETLYQDQVNGLKRNLREAEETSEILLGEKTTALDKLAESEQKSIDLQLQVDEANEKAEQLRRHHRTFSENTLKLCGVISTLGKRIVVLEKKLGIDDIEDVREIYRTHLGEEPPDISLDDDVPARSAAPKAVATPPIVMPAPKAVVVTPPAPVPAAETSVAYVEIHTPPPPVAARTVVLDGPEPESDSDASADDEDDGEEHEIDAAGVEDVEGDSSDEDDEESSEEDKKPVTCSFCKGLAKHKLEFVDTDGDDQELVACDPNGHGDKFLNYLKKNAASAPKSADDVITLFQPI